MKALIIFFFVVLAASLSAPADPLPGTQPLEASG